MLTQDISKIFQHKQDNSTLQISTVFSKFTQDCFRGLQLLKNIPRMLNMCHQQNVGYSTLGKKHSSWHTNKRELKTYAVMTYSSRHYNVRVNWMMLCVLWRLAMHTLHLQCEIWLDNCTSLWTCLLVCLDFKKIQNNNFLKKRYSRV